jgi:large subunit ribosomal protein L17
MKHRVAGRTLGRERNQRKALIKTLLGSLVMHERITTTTAKAKEIKNFIDQVVNKAKEARSNEDKKVARLRQLNQDIPAMAAKKMLSDFAERFSSRESGYVRIMKLEPRKSDGASMSVIEFV